MAISIHHRLLLILLAAVIGVLWAPLIVAQSSAAPGRIEVPVADDAAAAREAATREGIEQVLRRLTGRADIAEAPVGRRIRQNAGDYLQGFAYREAPVERSGPGDTDRAGATAGADEATALRLIARFDVRRLREALVAAGVPIWPERAPTVLAWVAMDAEGSRRILQAGDSDGLRAQLTAAAAALGVRVLFPIMDLEDIGALGYADIAGGFVEPVLRASQRYGADRVLAGRVAVAADGTRTARWLLAADAGRVTRWQAQGAASDALVEQTVENMVRRLRAAFAYLPDLQARTRLTVRIDGIVDLATHERVVTRLRSLSGVERVNPVRVRDGQVDFELAITTRAERVRQALDRDARLQPAADGYRWE